VREGHSPFFLREEAKHMSDKGAIHIYKNDPETGTWVQTDRGGDVLHRTVQRALREGQQQADDPQKFTGIVYQEMEAVDPGGCGIAGTFEYCEGERFIHVDLGDDKDVAWSPYSDGPSPDDKTFPLGEYVEKDPDELDEQWARAPWGGEDGEEPGV
jgi:hypothetical protein